MAKKKQVESIGGWDWRTLVASWRYYEYRHTISSATFPCDIIERFWQSGKYAKSALDQIARQFAHLDHGSRGEEDWSFMKSEVELSCDARPWCKFFAFCDAWYKDAFKTVVMDGELNTGRIHFEEKAFFCKLTKRWYSVNGYIANPHREVSLADEFIREVK